MLGLDMSGERVGPMSRTSGGWREPGGDASEVRCLWGSGTQDVSAK